MDGHYQVPAALGFRPEEELLLHYLRPKLNGEEYPEGVVHDYDIYCDLYDNDLYGHQEPWDIWQDFNISIPDDQEAENNKAIYFFTTLKEKTPGGSCLRRSVGTGSWKGEDYGKVILDSVTKNIIGFSKRFRYQNAGSQHDGGWIMHEFELNESLLRGQNKDCEEKNTVLCILRKNGRSEKRKFEERDDQEDAADIQPQMLSGATGYDLRLQEESLMRDFVNKGNKRFRVSTCKI